MVLRLLWRLLGGRPAALAGSARWQSATAEVTHWLLYAALFAMPLSGWLYNSASNFPLRWFGLFRVPALSERNPDLKEFAHDAHETLFWVIVALVVLHAGAALWHHLVRRDETLDRMLPARLRRVKQAVAGEDRP
jgi:cytochrome b561